MSLKSKRFAQPSGSVWYCLITFWNGISWFTIKVFWKSFWSNGWTETKNHLVKEWEMRNCYYIFIPIIFSETYLNNFFFLETQNTIRNNWSKYLKIIHKTILFLFYIQDKIIFKMLPNGPWCLRYKNFQLIPVSYVKRRTSKAVRYCSFLWEIAKLVWWSPHLG